MPAGQTLTLTAGSTDYIFAKTEAWTGIVGNGTRGVTLQTTGNTLYVNRLDHITGGLNLPGSAVKDVVYMQPYNGGSTLSVRLLETVYGSSGRDVLQIASTGSTMAVEGIETILGASTGTNLIALTSTAGNTMSVGYIKSIIGSAGKDVITFGAAGEGGTTAVVTMVETLIGTSGREDLIATVAGGSNTVSLSGIEVFLGNSRADVSDVLTLAGGGTIGVSFVETVIGSAARDVVTLGYQFGSVNLRTGGGTVAVSGIELIVGGTGPKNAAILLDQGNTVTVASLNTLIGGGGNDVVQMTLLDGTPIVGTTPIAWNTVGSTMQVSQIETLIGTSGEDAVVALNVEDATMMVSAVETIVGRQGIETILLGAGGNTVAVEGLETLIGGRGQDVVGLTAVASLRGSTMQVSGIETLIGGGATDVVVLSEAAGTIFVSDVETLYFAQTGQTLDVTGQTRQVVFPISVAAPAAPALSSASDTGVQGDLRTGATLPTLTGTAAAGTVINLYGTPPGASTARALGTGTANAAGQWSITANTALADGAWALTVKSVASGTESDASPALLLTIDATAPGAPTLGLAPGSDTGVSPTDGITNVVQPGLTGSAEAGSTVTLYDGALAIGTATADGVGVWSIAAPTLSAGTHTLSARAVDAAGNTGTASGPLAVTVDTTVAAPTLALGLASDTGTTGDNLTAVNTPVIVGSAEAFAVVSVIENGALLGSASADASGQWQLTLGALSEGAHTLSARAVDQAGNTSALSGSLALTIDTTPPAAPSAPTLAPASDSGISNSDRITGIAAPTFTGSAEAGSVIDLLVGGSAVGTGTAGGAGLWTITSRALGEGTQTVSTRVRDAAGNTRDGGGVSVTIDLTGPLAPSGIGLSAATDSGVQGDRVTNVAAPTIKGSAEAGSTVRLYEGASALGTALANGQGLWEIAAGSLGDGLHTLTARAEDAAGNTGAASSGFVVTIDRTVAPPTGLALTEAADTGDRGDGITRLSTPAIRGVAEAGSLVRLYEGQTLVGTGTADGQGAWTVTSSALSGGGHSLTAVAVDPAGNTSAASAALAITLDLVAPAAPAGLTLDGGSDSGTAGDGVTRVTAPVIRGSAEAGSRIALYDGGALVGTSTADVTTGLWSVQTATLGTGDHTLTARAEDAAGNLGAASLALALTIDTQAAAPAGLALASGSDSGASPSDRLTKVAAPVLTGSAEAGSRITLYDGGAAIGTGTADAATGLWSVQSTTTLSDGAHTLTAVAVDRADNTSAASAGLAVTVDTTAPAIGTPTADTDGVAPTLSGTAEAGSVVTLYDRPSGGAVLGTATAGSTGAWSIRTPQLAPATYTFAAQATDAAGNTGTAQLTLTLAGRPGIPGDLALATGSDSGSDNADRITNITAPVVTGTALAGAVVTLYDNGTLAAVGTTTAGTTGAWAITASALGDGTHILRATGLDGTTALGTSTPLTITIDTTGPSAGGLALQAASDTGASSSDRVTQATNPLVTGTAEAGSRVTLYDSDGTTAVGLATSAADGAWSATATLGAGAHTLTARAVDVAGNTGVASAGLDITVDTAADTPAIAALADDRGTGGAHLTRQIAPTLSGTAEAGSGVALYAGGRLVGTGSADASSGAWTIGAAALGDGTHTLTAQIVDRAGNTSAAATDFVLTIDSTAPGAPTAPTFSSDTGTAGDRVTRDRVQTLAGTAEAGSLVTLYDNGTALAGGTVLADGNGAWSVANVTLAAGVHTLTARSTDAAGNTGADSAALALTIDLASDAPSGLALAAASDTGLSASDRVTRETTLALTGSAEAASSVTLYDGATLLGTAQADGIGAWSYTVAGATEGAHTFTATAVDPAGNTSPASAALTVTVDRTIAAPPAPALDTGSDTGADTRDGLTRLLAPTLTGTVEAGAQVSLYEGTAFVGMTTADASGVWRISRALAEGAHTLSTRVIDPAGNSADSIGSLTVTIDATAPGAPSLPVLAAASDTGLSNSDRITQTTTPLLSGSAEAGSTVLLYDGAALVGTVAADTLGAWTLATGPLADGIRTLTARSVDGAGNTSAASAALTVTVDTATPVPSALGLSAATDTGRRDNDGVTSTRAPVLTGLAEAGATVTVTEGAATLGAVTAGSTGRWSLALPTLTAGSHTLLASATDVAGNASPAASYTLTVDVTADTPAVLGLDIASDSGAAGDRLTNVAAPLVTGTAEAGAAVSLYAGTRLLGIATADGAGAWSLRTPTLINGAHTLTATMVDLAGNSSAASAGLTLTIDTVNDAPSGALTAASDTGLPGDGLTRLANPAIAGRAEALSVITLYEGANALGTATADGAGAFTLTGASLGAGDHSLTLRSVDPAGNTSAASAALIVTVDPTTGQPSLALAAASDTGLSNSDRITAQNRPLLSGTAEAGSTVTLYADGSAVGTAEAGALGGWTLTTAALADGARTLTAVAVDRAGNTSAASADLVVTVDTRADAPALTAASLRSDSGTAGDAITNVAAPVFGGTTEAAGVVTLYEGATVRGTATADGTGAWSLTSAQLGNGAHTLTAQLVDRAGNTSAASAPLAVTIDTVAPGAATGLTLDPGSDTGLSNSDRITRNAMPAVTGSAEANATVTLFDGGTAVGTAVADGTGLFTVAAGTALTHGQHSLRVTVTDAAGNTGAATSPLPVTVDTVAPVLSPLALTAATDTGISSTDGITRNATPTVTGTVEANSTVTLLDGGAAIGTATANGLGVWSAQTTTLSAGTHTLTAVAVDRAGNTSAASAPFAVTVDTAAATPTALALAVDSGVSATDRLIDTGTLTLVGQVGTSEAGGLVQLYDGLNLVGAGTAGLDGAFTVTSGGLSNGTHALTARLIDRAGNTSAASTVLDVTIDTTAPGAPGGLALAAGSDDGASSSDRITTVTAPSVTGSAEAGSTVTLYDGATAVGTAVAGGGGLWTITSGTLAGSAAGMRHTLTALAVDAAGNTGVASADLVVTVDTAALAPGDIALTPASDSGALGDGRTRVEQPEIAGTAEAGSTVTLYEDLGGGNLGTLGSATADATGAWSIRSGTALAGGTGTAHTLFATGVDLAGNTSARSGDLVVTVKTVPDPVEIDLDAASDSRSPGGPIGDRITNATSLVLNGTAFSGREVVIQDGTTVLGTATAASTGSLTGGWSFTTGSLTSGIHTLTATSVDSVSLSGIGTLTVTIDTTGSAPGAPVLDPGSDSGRVVGDARTNVTAPVLTGTAEAGSTVTLYDGGSMLGTTTASSRGAWSFRTPGALAAGLHTLTASAVDVAGNAGGASAPLVLDIATTAAAPTGLALAPASDTGVQGDLRTRSGTPIITGTAQAGDVVALYDGAAVVGAATAGGGGTWAAQASGLGEGAHTLTATRVDVYGNTSTGSAALTVTVDTTAPGGPGLLALLPASDSGALANDRLTNALTPTVTGSAEAASTVTLYDGATALGTAVADGSGLWTVTSASTLPTGSRTLTAVAVDAAGNTGAASAGLVLTIDRAADAPTGLVLDAGSDTGSSAGDGITSDATPTVLGAAEAGSVVTLAEGAAVRGTATADGSGQWSITTASLAAGGHTLTATAIDRAGNTSAASTALTVTIDTATPAPSGLALASGSDLGRSSTDRVTAVATPVVIGAAEAASTVSLYDGGNLVGLATADFSGAWTVTASRLTDGTHGLTARSVDLAGNTSALSGSLAVTIDTAAANPTMFLAAGSDTGTAPDDLVTRTTTPTFQGSAEGSSTVQLYDGASLLGTTTADAGGAWTIASTALSEGARAIRLEATDVAGNVATTDQISVLTVSNGVTAVALSGLSLTIDTTAPATPGALALNPDSDSGIAGNGLTNVRTPNVTGTAEAGARILLYADGVLAGQADADDQGVWNADAAALSLGTRTLTARAVDAAGNTSGASAGLALTITAETAAPVGFGLAPASDSGVLNDARTNRLAPIVTGSAEAGSLVTLYERAQVLGTGTADGNGLWSVMAASLSAGVHSLTARARNVDGVDSGLSAPFALTIDTAAPRPVAGSLTVNGGTLTFSLDEAAAYAAAPDAAAGLAVTVDGQARAVTAIAGAGSATLVLTLASPVASGQAVVLSYDPTVAGSALADLAANEVAAFSRAVTNTTPAPAPDPGPGGGGGGTTVDGVAVQSGTQTNPDGTVSETVTIPVVTSSRQETVGGNTVADIPLVTGGGASLLTAQVPTGFGLEVVAPPAAAGLDGLIQAIRTRTAAGSADQAALTGGGASFLGALPPSTSLTVRTIVPVVAGGAVPGQPLVISGTVTGSDPTRQQAIVLDGSSLPTGTTIELENVDFAAVIGAVRLVGGDGSQLVFGDAADQYMVLGADDDTLRGGAGNDYVGSHGGNDLLSGDAGDDTVSGGVGNDTLTGGTERDLVYGNQDDDLIYGNQGQDTLYGGQGNDHAFGGQGDDLIFGNRGDDRLVGNLGADLIYGNQGADVIYGNQGADLLYGGQDADTLFGGQDGDVVYGNLGADVVYGNRGSDVLYGGQGDDTLFGGQDADTLVGGFGDDVLVGGLGADRYVIGRNAGRDVIVGFSAAEGDRIDLGGQGYATAATETGDLRLVLSGGGTVDLAGVKAAEAGALAFVT